MYTKDCYKKRCCVDTGKVRCGTFFVLFKLMNLYWRIA